MTNKDYKRLTLRNPVVTGRFSGKTLLNRLTALENAIDDGTLVFLPCKVGTEFWYIYKPWKMACRQEVGEFEVGDYGICIVDTFGQRYSAKDVYFTKEAAEKALEKMTK